MNSKNFLETSFLKATISHLGAIKPNHTPILLDTNPNEEFIHMPFRFEATWLRDNTYVPVIENAWNIEAISSEFIKLYKKHASTMDALRKWNKEVFGQCQDRINTLTCKIKDVQPQHPSQENEALESSLQAKLVEWLFQS